jgi:integrase
MIKRAGKTMQLDDMEVRQIQQTMMRASCDLAEALKARFEGDFSYEPNDPLLRKSLAQIYPTPAPLGAASTERAASAPAKHGKSFTLRAEEFRASQLRRNIWEKQTALQARKTFALFAEFAGDKALSEYARSHAAAFRNMLLDLPANYGKAVEYRGMSGREIVAATADQDGERLSPRTAQRHMHALSALWGEATEAGEVASNIFLGFRFQNSQKARDQRSMWTDDELTTLFATPIWRGSASKDRRSKPGEIVLRDEKFWLPLIAVFSGLRQEEICQLRPSDVRQESQIWVFDINSGGTRQVKNSNAVRLVPVHDELVKIGILAYVERQRAAGAELVFDQLTPGGADGRLGHNFTKWFTRYRRDVGLYRPSLDFHSFRHSATTFMQWANVAAPIIDELTGHAPVGETSRYTKSFLIEQLATGINSIRPKIDLSFLYAQSN